MSIVLVALLTMVACSSDDDSITDMVWHWESVIEQPSGVTTTVPDPETTPSSLEMMTLFWKG